MFRTISDELALERIRFALSGTEWDADTLDTIADLVRSTGRGIADSDEKGYIRTVAFAGFRGDRLQPPEPAEWTIWCPRCNQICDAVGDQSPVTCRGMGYGTHEVEVDLD
jgi:hypothetical protein